MGFHVKFLIDSHRFSTDVNPFVSSCGVECWTKIFLQNLKKRPIQNIIQKNIVILNYRGSLNQFGNIFSKYE